MTTEQFLHDAFEAAPPFGRLPTGETRAFGTFERLKEESGRVVTADVKEAALQQVLLYWRKLRTLAEQVTEAEVHLVPVEVQSAESPWMVRTQS